MGQQIILSEEAIKRVIDEGNYIPEEAKDHMTTEEFKKLYGLEALKKHEKGKELLCFLFGRREQNEKSLAYSLEKNTSITSFFCEAKPGYATTKILNNSNGSWKNGTKNIEENAAIETAYKVRNNLIQVLEKIKENTTAQDVLKLLQKQELPTKQNWLKKYLTILYPDKFMPMTNLDWTKRIFMPIELKNTDDWYENSFEFAKKAREYGVDCVEFYHVIRKCVIEQVESELKSIGIDPDRITANKDNFLINNVDGWNKLNKKYISKELLSKFEDFLSEKYDLNLKSKKLGEQEKDEAKSLTKQESKYTQTVINSKNVIFHGAPGTGKTYLAKQIAKDIIGDDGDYDKQVAFVQFHPSYDYSDFVEGLRPIEKDGNIGFELRDGTFKEFVERAIKNIENSQKSQNDIEKEQSVDDKINEFLEGYIDGESLKTLHGNDFYITSYDEKNIKINIPNNAISNVVNIKIDEIKKLLSAEQKFENVREIRKFFGKTNATQGHSYVYVIYKKILEATETPTYVAKEREELKNFVFIIDEINRGEISKIFGELFYSIEPGYRGNKDGVFTQYSNLHDNPNEKFYIPENVFIIGTMNDIDRSVDTFDFAMRRRFRFIEITAEESTEMLNSKLEEDIRDKAKVKMERLNEQISLTEGLNPNYHIGAAYFLNLKDFKNMNDDEKFDMLWENYLQPLLQDYVSGISDDEDAMKNFEKAYFIDYKNSSVITEGEENETVED